MRPYERKIYFTPEEEKKIRELKRKVAAYEDAYEDARQIVWECQKAEAERRQRGIGDFKADNKAREAYSKFTHLENQLRHAKEELRAAEIGDMTDEEIEQIASYLR